MRKIMEIPLKSKPKVSVVDILKLLGSKYNLTPAATDTVGESLKLTRTYSETGVSNFDEETGHRLYDDEVFRPKKPANEPGVSRIYSRSHGVPFGLEDEYIPGLNFSDVVYKWSDDLSSTTSSYLDLSDLHARVSPQRIQPTLPVIKRVKTNQSEFDLVLDSLPSNFNELPYSQRKRLVKSINGSIEYSQFSSYMKNFSGKKTLAGRLLSSTTDLKQIAPINVDEKGAKVMQFTLGKVIGFGAWGTIRECFGFDNEVYAMKIVSNKKSNILKTFKREIDIWGSLDHENILKLIKYLETEDTIFCLMNRINGGTLFDVVLKWGTIIDNPSQEENKKRIDLVGQFSKQISSGVKYLHDLGIVHGDIKLENILVDKRDPEDWKMIICDFGMSRYYKLKSSIEVRSKSTMTDGRKPYKGESLHSRLLLNELNERNRSVNVLPIKSTSRSSSPAKSQRHSPQLANSIESIKQYITELKAKELKRQSQVDLNLPDSHIGSLPYASPELLLPNPPPLGPSADIWALGIMIYTMVMGKLPFQHFYEPRLRAMIIKGNYNKQELLLVSSKPWVNEVISGCLEMDITRRLDIDSVVAVFSHVV